MNDYIEIKIATLADGSAKILEVKKLRELSAEVKRLYEVTNTPRIVDSSICDGKGNRENLFLEKILSPEKMRWLRDTCAAASVRLAEVEEKVFLLRETPITETLAITGFQEEKPKMIGVLDCQHPDGSVYSWYAKVTIIPHTIRVTLLK